MSGNENKSDNTVINQIKMKYLRKKNALHSALCQGQMEYNRSRLGIFKQHYQY